MLLKIHPENPSEKKIDKVVNCLKDGGVIIYPTDTIYALGCDIENKKAIDRLYSLKGARKGKDHFSIVCKDLSQISEFTVQFDNPVFKLMNRSFPGPYTYILNANNKVPKLFQTNKRTIGVRIPDNQISRMIVEKLGRPVLSTSLHDEDEIISYMADPEKIDERFNKIVDIIIDGGPGDNTPSTIVDCTKDVPNVIREGKGVPEI